MKINNYFSTVVLLFQLKIFDIFQESQMQLLFEKDKNCFHPVNHVTFYFLVTKRNTWKLFVFLSNYSTGEQF